MNEQQNTVLHPAAKINLFLDVGSLRSDGYHDIVSILQSIELHDRMTIQTGQGNEFDLSCDDISLPTDASNTLVKAWQAFRSHCPLLPTLMVRLEKKIPSQAGLGGGSSDAAALLHYLRQQHAPEMPISKLIEIAAEVGSDVPFFLSGGTCRVSGRGELIEMLPALPSFPVLILHPEETVSTREAYRALDSIPGRQHPPVDPMLQAIQKSDWQKVLQYLFNSFEEAVFKIHPRLGAICERCRALGFPSVLLSGSGSNLFVLDRDETRLRALQAEIAESSEGLRSTLTRTITTAEATVSDSGGS